MNDLGWWLGRIGICAAISCFAAAFAAGTSFAADAPKEELVWPHGAPDAKGDTPNDKPTLTIFPAPPEKATGTAVLVCPGGGYGAVAMGHEGHDVAVWLNSLGVSGFVLNYRHAGRGYHYPAPIEDAQRAMRSIRSQAAEWKLDPHKIGILGFSAGGHLASTIGTHFDLGKPDAADPLDRVSCRPDFMILCYPVVSLSSSFTHGGSLHNLLGAHPDEKLVELLSNEKHVTPETPPTFIFHTADDSAVPVENSIVFFEALRRAKVPVEMHLFEHGAHGLGLAPNDPALSAWPKLCAQWMRTRGLTK